MYARGAVIISPTDADMKNKPRSLIWMFGIYSLRPGISATAFSRREKSKIHEDPIPKDAARLSGSNLKAVKPLLVNIESYVGAIESFENSQNNALGEKVLFDARKTVSQSVPKNFNSAVYAQQHQGASRSKALDRVIQTIGQSAENQNVRRSSAVYAELRANTLTFEKASRHLYWNDTYIETYPVERLDRLGKIRPQPSKLPFLGEAIKNSFVCNGRFEKSKKRLKDFNDSIESASTSEKGMSGILGNFEMNLAGVSNELKRGEVRIKDIINVLRNALAHYYRDVLYGKARSALNAYNPPLLRRHGSAARSQLILEGELKKKLKKLAEKYQAVFTSKYSKEIQRLVDSPLSDLGIVGSIESINRSNELLNVFSGQSDSLRTLLKQVEFDESEPDIKVFGAFIYEQLIKDFVSEFVQHRFSYIPNLFEAEVVKKWTQQCISTKSILDMVNNLGKLPFRSALEVGCQLMGHILHREIIIDSEALCRADHPDGARAQDSRLYAVSPVFRDGEKPSEHVPFLGIKTTGDKRTGLSFNGLPIPEEVREDILNQLHLIRPGEHKADEYHFSRYAWRMAQVNYQVNPNGLITTDQPSPLTTTSLEDEKRIPLHVEFINELKDDFHVNKSLLSKHLLGATLR